ncbi:MAG: RnfABCDGE type electron transport complex subunit D [Oscillospiraceae bacterium]
MRLSIQRPPHIRSKDTNFTVMLDMISVATCVVSDVVCVMLARRVPNMRDFSAVITGMLIPLLMPVSISWEIVVSAGLFAILVAKHPFGGVGQNVFNPAAAGVAFAMVCWSSSMFSYVAPFHFLPIKITEALKFVTSPAKALSLGGVPSADFIDMLLGNVAGPMGATNILVLLACLLFLSARKTINLSMTTSFIVGASLIAVFLPRADMSGMESFLYEMMSGYMVIGAIFLINDPVTSPKRALPKVIYGFTAGIVGMGFRHIGRYEESLLFAILIMNSSVWVLDLLGEHIAHYYRRKQREYQRNTKAQILDEENSADIKE